MNAHPLPRCLLRLATTDPTSKRGWLKEDCGQQVVARGTESAWSANGEPLQQPGMEALWTEDVLLRCLLLHGPAGGNASLEAGAGGALPARRALRAAPRSGHPRVLLLRRGSMQRSWRRYHPGNPAHGRDEAQRNDGGFASLSDEQGDLEHQGDCRGGWWAAQSKPHHDQCPLGCEQLLQALG
ncbi:unnamed protein product, partial [Effrenium voratum]